MGSDIIKILRIKAWWHYIVPPLMGIVYFSLLVNQYDVRKALSIILLYIISIFGTAVFGFFLNDIADWKSDMLAGKENYACKLKTKTKVFVIILSLFCALLPWYFLGVNLTSSVFLVIQFALLIFYSVKPFRLKERIFLSIISDSLYSGLLFAFAIIFSQIQPPFLLNYSNFILIAVFFALLSRGLRNILMHQIIDAEFDKKSNTNTLITNYGKNLGLRFIKLIIRLEILFLIIVCVLLSFTYKYMWLIIPAFLLYYLLKRFDIKKIQNFSSSLQVINDFYEDAFPLCILIYLTTIDVFYLLIAITHILIFKNKIVWLLIEKVIYGYLYRKIAIWLYYKMFHNKYVKKYFSEN